MSNHTISRCYGCPHSPVPDPLHKGACPLSASKSDGDNKLSRHTRQIQECIEAQITKLDRALRRTWLLLGGIVLPATGGFIYALTFLH